LVEQHPSGADLFCLDGRTALVTGGSRGLGREIVRGFARAGADVVIASRRLENCELLAREVRETTGREAMAYACSVGKWSELDGLVEAVYDRFGRLDVLVNNAGMAPLYDSPTDITEELFDKTLSVNFKGPFRLTALVGTRMMADGRGSIINISAAGAVRPAPNVLPYAAAKAALNNATLGFAQAFGPHVRVNCIMPGPFLTDIARHWTPESIAEREKRMTLRRIGQPHEIVGAALFFASDASSFTTGTVLPVDGGLL
jgi:NAD(P)-dependent dehydrogenase (short-subunit alcohol dehydrogenase family)